MTKRPRLGLPLYNKRIVVTRAKAQAQGFYQSLLDLGAKPILFPTIQIMPLDDLSGLVQAIQRLGSYDWLIFTSINAFSIFWGQWLAAGSGIESLEALKIATVGSVTAQVVAQHGLKADFTPAKFVAANIAAGLGDVTGQKILLPQAEMARPMLTALLNQAGAIVHGIPIYHTVPAPVNPETLTELQTGLDVITFTSGSTVQYFVQLLEKQTIPLLQQVKFEQPPPLVACIGPATAQVASDLNIRVDLVARTHTTQGLIQALLDYFA